MDTPYVGTLLFLPEKPPKKISEWWWANLVTLSSRRLEGRFSAEAPKSETLRLWRSQTRKSRSVPAGGADFPAAIFLAGKCPNLGRDSISCCRKIGEEFRKLPVNLSSKEFRTATTFSSFLTKPYSGAVFGRFGSHSGDLPVTPGSFQVTVCGVTVCPFSRHIEIRGPKCL